MNKKIIISLAIFLCCSFLLMNIFKNDEPESVVVNATAITSRVIVVDAGHGKPDEGATGIYGTTEEAINLRIALKLQVLIEQSGGIVYLTRSDENGIYSSEANTIREKKIDDVRKRVVIGNDKDVDVYVAIHLNKFSSSTYSGWQTFYQSGSGESETLARSIQNALNLAISTPNNRVPLVLKGVYIMDRVENPTVTVECGFLSNPTEARNLEDDEYQEKLAWGIYIGLQEYFNN